MGIPRLMQALATSGQSCLVGSSSASKNDSQAVEHWVIDGPSLVYYAYDSLPLRQHARPPAYREVNTAVKSFLHMLELHHIYIEAIFFDGALPTAKRITRLQRLERTRKEMVQCWRRTSMDRLQIVQLAPLPPPPFLVPSAIESLLESDWAQRVSVVPEEADISCARVAAHDRVSILTNDSDLALFDIRSESRIVWLNSLSKTKSADAESRTFLLASVLYPAKAAKHWHLQSLTRLGFERLHDPAGSIAMILERARAGFKDESSELEYVKFCQLYTIPHRDIGLSDSLKELDPRTAEFVVQVLVSTPQPHLYLPILHEDPSCHASWTYGTAIRQLAYSLFALGVCGAVVEVAEHYRKGERIAATTVEVLSRDRVVSVTTGLLETMELFLGEMKNVKATSVIDWWMLATVFLSQEKTHSSTLLSPTAFYSLFSLGKGHQASKTSNWADMHLAANIQAILYSLRMLLQIINYVTQRWKDTGLLHLHIQRLRNILTGMLPLEALFLDIAQLRSQVETMGESAVRQMLLKAQQQHPEAWLPSKDSDTERGNKAKKRCVLPRHDRQQTSGNRFAPLAIDDENSGGCN